MEEAQVDQTTLKEAFKGVRNEFPVFLDGRKIKKIQFEGEITPVGEPEFVLDNGPLLLTTRDGDPFAIIERQDTNICVHTVNAQKNMITETAFLPGAELTIGRGPANAIDIGTKNTISRDHARLIFSRSGGKVVVKIKNAGDNGTSVWRVGLEAKRLSKPYDVSTIIKVFSELSSAKTTGSSGIELGSELQFPLSEEEICVMTDGAYTREPILMIKKGLKGVEVSIAPRFVGSGGGIKKYDIPKTFFGKDLLIGRLDAAVIKLQNNSASREHASIRFQKDDKGNMSVYVKRLSQTLAVLMVEFQVKR